MALAAAVSPATTLSDRARPARADPHDQLRELRGLVIARGPLRRALAAVVGQLVATRAWERLGFARLRDYAVERAGHSARSLQDLARVDAALAGLPRVETALVEGELTWTKARLLCRVATVDDEGLWVAFAREKTARALSREVRAVDVGALELGAASTDEDGAPEEESETVQLRCTPVVRARWWQARQLARRVAGEALPVWGCMEAIAAEVVSALPLEVETELAPPPGPRACATPAPAANVCAEERARGDTEREPAQGQEQRTPSPREERSPGASPASPAPQAELPPFLAPLVVGLESADAFELDERLRRAVALEQRLEAEMGRLFLRIAEGRLHRAAGFTSMDEYAREQLGISPRKARALLRLERAGRRARLLREAYRDGRLSWVQAHALLPVLAIASPHQHSWIEWACAVTVRRLQEDVEQALVLHETDPDGRSADTDSHSADANGRPADSDSRPADTDRRTADPDGRSADTHACGDTDSRPADTHACGDTDSRPADTHACGDTDTRSAEGEGDAVSQGEEDPFGQSERGGSASAPRRHARRLQLGQR